MNTNDAKLEVLEELIEEMGGLGVLKRLEARMQAKAGAQEAPLEGATVPAELGSESAPKPEDEEDDEDGLKFKGM